MLEARRISSIETEIDSIMKDFEFSKLEMAKAEGQYEEMVKQLAQFGVMSVEEANEKLKKLYEELAVLEEEIIKNHQDLKKRLEHK
jgi:hypothetical protein